LPHPFSSSSSGKSLLARRFASRASPPRPLTFPGQIQSSNTPSFLPLIFACFSVDDRSLLRRLPPLPSKIETCGPAFHYCRLRQRHPPSEHARGSALFHFGSLRCLSILPILIEMISQSFALEAGPSLSSSPKDLEDLFPFPHHFLPTNSPPQ